MNTGTARHDRPVTICQLCRKRVYRVRNGEWYHRGNASAFCHPGDGTHRKALPLTLENRKG